MCQARTSRKRIYPDYIDVVHKRYAFKRGALQERAVAYRLGTNSNRFERRATLKHTEFAEISRSAAERRIFGNINAFERAATQERPAADGTDARKVELFEFVAIRKAERVNIRTFGQIDFFHHAAQERAFAYCFYIAEVYLFEIARVFTRFIYALEERQFLDRFDGRRQYNLFQRRTACKCAAHYGCNAFRYNYFFDILVARKSVRVNINNTLISGDFYNVVLGFAALVYVIAAATGIRFQINVVMYGELLFYAHRNITGYTTALYGSAYCRGTALHRKYINGQAVLRYVCNFYIGTRARPLQLEIAFEIVRLDFGG